MHNTTSNIAIARAGYRRNVTFTTAPTPEQIDALIRNGFHYDEKAQQWWKIERAGKPLDAQEFFTTLDESETNLREAFGIESPNRDEHQRRYQSYYTPDDLATELVKLAEIKEGMRCLEPSAGNGALVRPMIEGGASVVSVEADPDAFLYEGDNCVAIRGDFLDMDTTPASLGGTFDRIVMNPPFSRDQDARHVCHAWTFLKPGGKLVAIVGHYALNGKTDDRRRFQDLMRQHGRIIRELPPGTFDNNARAVIIELAKHAA